MAISTESLARASRRRPWLVVGIGVALIVAALVTSTALLGDALTTEFSFTNNPESKRADKLLEERLRGPREIPEIIMVQSETLTVETEAFRSKVEELQQRILDVGADKVTGVLPST